MGDFEQPTQAVLIDQASSDIAQNLNPHLSPAQLTARATEYEGVILESSMLIRMSLRNERLSDQCAQEAELRRSMFRQRPTAAYRLYKEYSLCHARQSQQIRRDAESHIAVVVAAEFILKAGNHNNGN